LCDNELEGTARAASQYVFDLGGGCVVDAMAMGNATRRINHDAEAPNISSVVVNHYGVRKVCMYAKVDINRAAELTFDYGRTFYHTSNEGGMKRTRDKG
jgi:SET domain-containing protein